MAVSITTAHIPLRKKERTVRVLNFEKRPRMNLGERQSLRKLRRTGDVRKNSRLRREDWQGGAHTGMSARKSRTKL